MNKAVCCVIIVAKVVGRIKNHDTYVMKNGETIKWMKQKGMFKLWEHLRKNAN